MKILIFGDIHGRTVWEDILKVETYDKVIFLGDYVSTHDEISSDTQIRNLENILQFKQENPDKVILLRGNHDLQHLGYSWAECSGLFPAVLKWMETKKDLFLSLTQWVYVYNDFLFSHAGVSKLWMMNNDIETVQDINNMECDQRFGFTPENWFTDFCGESRTQPPTWIRPYSLLQSMPIKYKQVVGHTNPNYVLNPTGFEDNIYLCDRLDTQYAILDEDKFTFKKHNFKNHEIQIDEK